MSFRLKAVITDDSSVMRKVLRGILEGENFEVVGEAEDGLETLEMCKEMLPNLLTLDITMPRMDGISCLKEVKKISSDIKVVMITSLDRMDTMIEALQLGAENYITKPYQADKVARVINTIRY